MKFSQKLNIALSLIGKRITKAKSPFLVSWSLTTRCNHHCEYCGIWKMKSAELNTKEALFVIDELSRCGNKAIAFTGGEPLIREDIAQILNHCYSKGIYTKLTTNGSLVKDRINDLKKVGFVRLSFDGPKKIHDFQRQAGSYDEAVKALELLKKNNIKAGLNCVISKLNAPYINDILNEAKRMNVRVSFQPLEYRNNRDFLFKNMPTREDYKNIFGTLIAEKKRGNKNIANSLTVLNYIFNGPGASKINCWAGLLIWRITPEGKITACDRLESPSNSYSCLSGNLDRALNKMAPINCEQMCLRNYTIELNYLLSFRLSILLSLRYDF